LLLFRGGVLSYIVNVSGESSSNAASGVKKIMERDPHVVPRIIIRSSQYNILSLSPSVFNIVFAFPTMLRLLRIPGDTIRIICPGITIELTIAKAAAQKDFPQSFGAEIYVLVDSKHVLNIIRFICFCFSDRSNFSNNGMISL
jgi:hypothetical protein